MLCTTEIFHKIKLHNFHGILSFFLSSLEKRIVQDVEIIFLHPSLVWCNLWPLQVKNIREEDQREWKTWMNTKLKSLDILKSCFEFYHLHPLVEMTECFFSSSSSSSCFEIENWESRDELCRVVCFHFHEMYERCVCFVVEGGRRSKKMPRWEYSFSSMLYYAWRSRNGVEEMRAMYYGFGLKAGIWMVRKCSKHRTWVREENEEVLCRYWGDKFM